MGKKGFKSFVKASAAPPGDDEDEAQPQEQPKAPKQQQQPAASSPAKKAAAPTGNDSGAGSDDEEGSGGGGPETRGQMLQRHKREMLAHKKALQRAGKKSKDEVARLTADIEKRHAEELRRLGEGGGGGGGGGEGGEGAVTTAAAGGGQAAGAAPPPLSKYLADLSVDGGGGGGAQARRPSKAQRRREKHAARDAERDARIAAEKEQLGTPERLEEEAALAALLAPLGLRVREIRADGHCMYRSLEDQLRATLQGGKKGGAGGGGGGGDDDEEEDDDDDGVPNYQDLRELAAAHIRSHRDDFAPYIVPEDGGGAEGGGGGEEAEEAHRRRYYDKYCDDIEMTATWGGHVELTALSVALRRRIVVHSVGMAPVVVGEQHAGPPLTVCYLRHALGVGEHYNSVEPLAGAGARRGNKAAGEDVSDGGDGSDEEEDGDE